MKRAVLVATRLCAAAALMFLACSSGTPKAGAGGGKGGVGQTGGSGGTNVEAGGAGGGQTGGDGGTKVDAGGGGQTGGDGGTKVDAGGGGQGGGDGGTDANPLTLPGCLSDLLSACPLTRPCVYSTTDAGQNVCFAAAATDPDGGARATVTSMSNFVYPNGDCTPSTLVTVAKADGSPCYSIEIHEPIAFDCTEHTWTWKDASGQIVATGSVYEAGTTRSSITCAVGGAQTACVGSYPDPGNCCHVSIYGSPACPDGVPVSACSAGACP